MISTKPTPSPREDGLCVICGKQRRIPDRLQRGVSMKEYELDPFCSNKCAKAYYGTIDDTTLAAPGRPPLT